MIEEDTTRKGVISVECKTAEIPDHEHHGCPHVCVVTQTFWCRLIPAPQWGN